MSVWLLSLFFALSSARAEVLLLEVQGMGDACCADNVQRALAGLPFVAEVSADPATGLACLRLQGSLDEEAMTSALNAAGGYTVRSSRGAAACPEAARAVRTPWADVGGLDVAVISRGELVDLEAHLAPGKVTLFDFSAPWCAPCWTSAERLREVLASDPGLAVRVVELEGKDALVSFALPAATQHLAFAEGLPYFVVLNAKGRAVYKGSDLEAALGAARTRR